MRISTATATALSLLAPLIATTEAFSSPGFSSTIRFTPSRLTTVHCPSRTYEPLRMVSTTLPPPTCELPELGTDGVYHIRSKEQYTAFLASNQDKLIVLKFFAPWCKACQSLNPRFQRIVDDPKYASLPLLFSDLSVSENKEFVKSLGVLALPSIRMYAGSEGLVENFPCGPSKVPILKAKLDQLINDRIDTNTNLLIHRPQSDQTQVQVDTPRAEWNLTTIQEGGIILTTEQGQQVSQQTIQWMRNKIPYFTELTEDEFNALMKTAKLLSFDPNSIIAREGKPGHTFYVIHSGEVEVSCRTAFEDPLTTPSFYLGSVINRLKENDYFGERALITGEPMSASIVTTKKTTCIAFDIADIPPSSILSGKHGAASADRMQQVNTKYGVDVGGLDMLQVSAQLEASKFGNQIRGSLNSPNVIRGVDTDEDIVLIDDSTTTPTTTEIQNEHVVISLLGKFRMIRHAARCFDYIMSTATKWGDGGSQRRRSMLVSRLTEAQKEEFQDVFAIIDTSRNGEISLLELKRFMESVGEPKSDDELQAMISGSLNGKEVISKQDFIGIMAEADFYHLFKDTFASLDKYQSGFVKARELDRVLCGMRDLISDDRKSIIDVEDQDMMIDYEQFSKMLLGTTL